MLMNKDKIGKSSHGTFHLYDLRNNLKHLQELQWTMENLPLSFRVEDQRA